MKASENSLTGSIRIAQITSINVETFRAQLTFYDNPIGSSPLAWATPHPLFGIMPRAGSNVLVYCHNNGGNYILFPLSEPDNRSPADRLSRVASVPGLVPYMKEDEAYIGRSGRAYFDADGNVRISSLMNRCMIELKAKKSRTEISGYDFDIFTPGKGVRFHSTHLVPVTPLTPGAGDGFSLEINIPVAPVADSLPEVLPTTISKLDMDKIGNFEVSVFRGMSKISADVLGNMAFETGPLIPTTGLRIGDPGSIPNSALINRVFLRNKWGALDFSSTNPDIQLYQGYGVPTAILEFDALSNISLRRPKAGLKISAIPAPAEVHLFNAASDLEMWGDGSLYWTNNVSSIFSYTSSRTAGISAGNLNLFGDAVATMVSLGPATVQGTTTNLIGTLITNLAAPVVNIVGVAATNVTGAAINIGAVPAGHVAIAEMMIATFVTMQAFNKILQLHTHPYMNFGAVNFTFPSLELNAAGVSVPPVPSAAASGSLTVTVQK